MIKEIEVLYALKSSSVKAKEILSDFGEGKEKKTLDVYYYDPKRKELKPDRKGRLLACFRLRTKDGHNYMTYKVDHFRGDEWLYSDEHETEVGSAEVVAEIISHLGLEELVRVDMTKTTYDTDDYEIALEEVKGLGRFLEVESKKMISDGETDEEKQNIRNFVDSLGLKIGEEMNAGKPELIINKSKKYGHICKAQGA